MSTAWPRTTTTSGPYRQQIVTAAIELTANAGWAAVTMSKLAEIVGVSRQTVYNELGSKTALAEAMVSYEFGRFLALVRDAFDRHPDDLIEAIYDAIRDVLENAHDNTLLRAIASATHGADTELLPLLTTHAGSLLTEVKAMLAERVRSYRPPLSEEQITVLIDIVVRTVLSHVMQPTDSPTRIADGIAWIVARALDTTPSQSLRHGTAP